MSRSSSVLLFMAGAATASVLFLALHHQRRRQRHQTAPSISQSSHSVSSLPPSLEHELFARVVSFFGEESFPPIQKAFVVVVGLGGVGSHAAHMLVRSGVQRIRVIDFDQVTLSSLNRHAVAGLKDVGLSKAEVLKTRLMELGLPRLQIDACRALFKMDTASVLLGPWKGTGGGEGEEGVLPTYVLDCIDDVQTKAELLMYAQDQDLRVISALGAGLKADPTRLCIGELDNTKNEPLAIKLRYLLRKQGRACTGITTVYSHEKPRGSLLPLTDEQEAAPSDFGILEHMRLRVLPVLGTMPALFGQAMAAFVLCELAGQSLQPVAVEGLSRNVKHRLLQHLRNRERATFQNRDTNDISMQDIEEVCQDIWRCRCVLTGARLGTGKVFALTRWDKEKPPLIENLVLFSSAALADKFDVEGPGMLPNERRKRVEARLNLFA